MRKMLRRTSSFECCPKAPGTVADFSGDDVLRLRIIVHSNMCKDYVTSIGYHINTAKGSKFFPDPGDSDQNIQCWITDYQGTKLSGDWTKIAPPNDDDYHYCKYVITDNMTYFDPNNYSRVSPAWFLFTVRAVGPYHYESIHSFPLFLGGITYFLDPPPTFTKPPSNQTVSPRNVEGSGACNGNASPACWVVDGNGLRTDNNNVQSNTNNPPPNYTRNWNCTYATLLSNMSYIMTVRDTQNPAQSSTVSFATGTSGT